MLQAEFDQTIQGSGVQAGSVVQTGGHGLPCNSVLHAVLPSWDGGQGNAMKVTPLFTFLKALFPLECKSHES